MQRAIFLSLLIALPCFAQVGQHATYRLLVDKDNDIVIYLQDQTYSPGSVRTTDVKEVCSERTKQFRKTTGAMKKEVYAEYQAKKGDGAGYEIDHIVALEIGGADEVVNLWPQPYPQAHWKDAVEGWLRRQVCATLKSEGPEAGNAALIKAQHDIADNWYILFQEMNSGPRPTEKEDKRESPASASAGQARQIQQVSKRQKTRLPLGEIAEGQGSPQAVLGQRQR